jgi:hypothetical protein
VSRQVFGEEHLTTQMARDMGRFLPDLVYPEVGWQPERLVLELDRSFGSGDASYIH